MGLSGEISGEDVQGFFGGGDFPGRVFFLGGVLENVWGEL